MHKLFFRFVLFGVALVGGLLIVSCGRIQQLQDMATVDSFVDDYGRTIAVPDHSKRIVSVSPAVTEIVCDLGGKDLLVGRTDFCVYPPEVSEIASVGGISNLNVEKVASLQPDLVISGSMVPKKTADLMEKLGIPMVCVIEKTRFEGLFENIEKIGRLAGLERQADSLVGLLQSRYDALPTVPEPLPTIYYVVGFGKNGNFTAGGTSFINDILTLSGGRNIASDLHGWEYSLEALLSADPDYVVIRQEDSALFCQTKPYNTLSAVRNGHVIGIESGMIDAQVPRNLDCIEQIRSVIARGRQ